MMISEENQRVLDALKLNTTDLTGKTALITGAAMGIGEYASYTLSHLGANIIVVDFNDKGAQVAETINQNGGKATFIHCDLRIKADLETMFEEAAYAFGGVDILINNAMISVAKPLVLFEYDEWKSIFDTNLTPAFLSMKYFLPQMLEKKFGIMVNMIAYEGTPLAAAYAATKVGLRSLAYTTAREVGEDAGVSIFSFVPGIVDTPFIREQAIPAVMEMLQLDEQTIIDTILSQNPGYNGLMPVEHCASALAYTIVRAQEYHGTVADPFEPLDRFDIIEVSDVTTEVSTTVNIEASMPQHIKHFLSEVNQNNKDLEKRIQIRTNELDVANKELTSQRKEIIDSINYAKRIQTAILPPDNFIKEHLKNSFVLYLPKDIVAGDFYWMEAVEDKVLFAAADCTGHGVPGAMVSVICNNALNRSVREYGLNDPSMILNKTREIVIQEFEKSEEDVSDGMDIALCSLKQDPEALEGAGAQLEYAGAHNPLWVIRNGAEEVEEIKANKQPIGKFDTLESYTSHTIQLNPGDTFYIFSDGFADQFGGEKGKKFRALNFKKLLLSIQKEGMPEQLTLIQESFENWKGSLEQLDDVCVIGVRV